MGSSRGRIIKAPAKEVETLEAKLGCDWPNIRAARASSLARLHELESVIKTFESSDRSVVVFGSLARREYTPESDLDWILLLDGSSSPEDLETAHAIRAALDPLRFRQPGQEQTFATLVSSHDLINYIGGQDDTNANTTRRILLLLESTPICRDDAYNRVVNNVFKRYLSEDYGLWHGSKEYKVPRFFLNDIARYWRTMAVDFAYKQRARNNKGFALRNIKLRFSRKLIFLVGLITCFECHLAFSEEQRNEIYGQDKEVVAPVIEKIRECVAIPPLDLLARVLLRHPEYEISARAIFDAYEEFIGLLASEEPLASGENRRQRLANLRPEELDRDEVFQYGRDISHRFQDGIRDIFLKPDSELGQLTIEYGVF